MLDTKFIKLAVITAHFNDSITSKLKEGVHRGLLKLGVDEKNINHFDVPGAMEIASLASKLASIKKHHCFICNGAVIRGETSHFDQVINSATNGLTTVSVNRQVPIIQNILACHTTDQALARADGKRGYDTASSAVKMAILFESLEK